MRFILFREQQDSHIIYYMFRQMTSETIKITYLMDKKQIK